MRSAAIALLALSMLSAAPKTVTLTGVITDDLCATTGHQAMRMGPTDADCTRACVLGHGALYVLLDGKQVYGLSDQKAPEKFAGQRVRVTGTLDATTKKVTVQSIAPAK